MSRKITITIEEDNPMQQEFGYPLQTFPQRRYNPCEFCSNNPQNNPHASGICHCALPALINGPIY